MVIFDEDTSLVLIDSITSPIKATHFWVLDLAERDFKLAKIETVEEHVTEMLVLSIYGYAIEIPANWQILIVSSETNQLDVVDISEFARNHYQAFVYTHENSRLLTPHAKVIHYEPAGVSHMPSLAKHQMLCHGVGPRAWICIAPSINYNKYIKNTIANDIIY